MRVDLRVKHDVEARKAAIGLFELGHGYKSAAIALSLLVEAVRRWQEIYRAFGSEVLLPQGGRGGRDSRQDRAQDDTRDGDSLRYQTRDGLPQVQLVQGRRRQDVRERDREGFRRRGPVAEAGNGRHRVQGGGRQGLQGSDAGLLFEDFKRDLEEYIVHWNTSRRQVRLKGLTPEEFRNQALAA